MTSGDLTAGLFAYPSHTCEELKRLRKSSKTAAISDSFNLTCEFSPPTEIPPYLERQKKKGESERGKRKRERGNERCGVTSYSKIIALKAGCPHCHPPIGPFASTI